MTPIPITAFELAQRFIGIREVVGAVHNPLIVAMLRLDGAAVQDDETPWCGGFANFICWLLRLPRSKSLAARSWLAIGEAVPLELAVVGFDVVILQRGDGPQLGPLRLDAPGHVGFFAGMENSMVLVLAGNQGNAVSVMAFHPEKVLGVRRLRTA